MGSEMCIRDRAGGRLVANRRGTASTTQLGSRRQRYADLRVSMGLNGG